MDAHEISMQHYVIQLQWKSFNMKTLNMKNWLTRNNNLVLTKYYVISYICFLLTQNKKSLNTKRFRITGNNKLYLRCQSHCRQNVLWLFLLIRPTSRINNGFTARCTSCLGRYLYHCITSSQKKHFHLWAVNKVNC